MARSARSPVSSTEPLAGEELAEWLRSGGPPTRFSRADFDLAEATDPEAVRNFREAAYRLRVAIAKAKGEPTGPTAFYPEEVFGTRRLKNNLLR